MKCTKEDPSAQFPLQSIVLYCFCFTWMKNEKGAWETFKCSLLSCQQTPDKLLHEMGVTVGLLVVESNSNCDTCASVSDRGVVCRVGFVDAVDD